MSVNVYLKGDPSHLAGFEVKERRAKDGQTWKEYSLQDLSLSRDKGRWYFWLSELDDPIPEAVKDLVEEVSSHVAIPKFPQRILGIYHLKDAEAELDIRTEGKFYSLRMRGKNIEHIRVLYRMIRAGTILPGMSYEDEQISPPTRRLKELWHEAMVIVRRTVSGWFHKLRFQPARLR